MGLLDKLKGMLQGNSDKVKDGLEKAGDLVDDKTGGKFSDKIDMATDKVAEVVEDQVEGEDETPEA